MPPAKKAAGTTSGHPASKTSKTSKTSTSRKAVLSTAEQLDRLEEAKRAKHKSHRKKGDKQHAGALEPSGTLQQIDLSGLEPVEELVAPTLAVLNAISRLPTSRVKRALPVCHHVSCLLMLLTVITLLSNPTCAQRNGRPLRWSASRSLEGCARASRCTQTPP